jgi:hypothetical protein
MKVPKGKIYIIIKKHIYYYSILNDNNILFDYPLKYFKPLYEIRNEKINRLLE